MEETHSIEIPVGDFDVSLLPADARQAGSDAFRQAVSSFIENEFQGFAGWVRIVVDDQRLRVSWQTKPEAPNPLDEAIKRLRDGDSARGIQLLKLILAARPRDALVHYNLGMAFSDMGKLDEAEVHLREAVRLDTDTINAHVALGVALMRKRQYREAEEILEGAVQHEPDNPFALRNLAGCWLAQHKNLEAAETHLRQATGLAPQDQHSWFGLAQALEDQQKLDEADRAYLRVIELNAQNEMAAKAKESRTALAQRLFRQIGVPGLRMDAMMYCLSALEKFSSMQKAEIQKVAFEIAALGTKGISPNDPDSRYTLRTMAGSFSGLELLCHMFVGFKKIDPNTDIGFDLNKEYQAAVELLKKKSEQK